jgi:hypothetical protein
MARNAGLQRSSCREKNATTWREKNNERKIVSLEYQKLSFGEAEYLVNRIHRTILWAKQKDEAAVSAAATEQKKEDPGVFGHGDRAEGARLVFRPPGTDRKEAVVSAVGNRAEGVRHRFRPPGTEQKERGRGFRRPWTKQKDSGRVFCHWRRSRRSEAIVSPSGTEQKEREAVVSAAGVWGGGFFLLEMGKLVASVHTYLPIWSSSSGVSFVLPLGRTISLCIVISISHQQKTRNK